MISINKKKLDDGIIFYEIKTPKYELTLANVGASIYDLKTFDNDRELESIVIRLNNPNDLFKNDAFFGSSVGRNAGRIKDGQFSINNKSFNVPKNSVGNNLHSSGQGISCRIMESKIRSNSVIFKIVLSTDDDGFPGNISILVTYTINENDFIIKYNATSKEDTICNMTNHTYFNLSGNLKNDIFSHKLDFNNLKSYWELDESSIPTTKKECSFSSIKEFNDFYLNSPQIGMDHPFEVRDNLLVLSDEQSGRKLKVTSSYDYVVLYAQNNSSIHAGNKRNRGIAIEFQHLPNDININKNKSKTILRKHEKYNEWIKYSFEQ